jgi:hypothetical protein
MCRTVCMVLALAWGLTATVHAQEPKSEVTEGDFQRLTVMLIQDPTNPSAKTYAKVILVFTMQTPKAAVVLGKEELQWAGEDKEKSLLLMAAYVAGNTQSQLDSGIMRDDKYAGLLKLFHVYRKLKEAQKDFKNDAVEQLIQMHQKGTLVGHLQELEKKSSKEPKKKLEP